MLNNSQISLSSNPVDIRVSRSKMILDHEVITTFDSGQLIPIYIDDILPGDTVTMRMNSLVRMTTPIYPVMDQAMLDVFWFFVPKRLTWTHWVNLRGENSNTYWETPVEYTVPQIVAPEGGWNVGSIADQFGIPPKIDGFSVDALPFRGLGLIWNEWFRSESITQPISIPLDDADVQGTNGTWSDYVTEGYLGGEPLRVARYHDIFSSALLMPQSGDASVVPVVGYGDVNAPVVAKFNADNLLTGNYIGKDRSADLSAIRYAIAGSNNKWNAVTANTNSVISSSGFGQGTSLSNTPTGGALAIDNLYAELGQLDGGIGISINALRNAVVVQQVLEQLNKGNRYTEILENLFHITSPDARLQRPEFLGYRQIPITVSEINQTSSTDATSPLGNPGANSKTFDGDDDEIFQHSFLEDGYLYGLCCVRPTHTYSQGLRKFWRKRSRFDYFYPQMVGLGDRPVLNSEIYLQPDSVVNDDGEPVNDDVFGYNSAWYEYFTAQSQTRGLMRPYVNQSLAVWNYSDNYDSLPILSTDWLYEDGSQIGRTLAIQNQPQFKADFYFKPTYVRPVPVNMAPGLTRI